MLSLLLVMIKSLLSGTSRRRTEELYRNYHAILRRRCFRLLRDESLVEDAMQDVFWTISRRVDQYRGKPAEILPWLYRITTTHCLKLIEKNQRWHRNLELAMEEGRMRYQHNLSANELEAKVSVNALLHRMPSSQRQAVVYRHVSGMTQQEIAEVMQVTRDQVRTWLKRFEQQAQTWREEIR